MKKLLALLLLPLSASALTPISDTLYTATGGTALPGSYLLIKWPRFASGANHAVLPSTQTVPLINGTFSVSLEPTSTAQQPFQYTVEYHLISASGPQPTYTETWDVPDTAARQTIASVLVTPAPASAPAPLAKGDLATSDGAAGVVLHAPQQAGYILETDPTAPSGLSYQALTSLTAGFDAAGAAAAAQTAADSYTNLAISQLGSAAQHAATDFDAAGVGAAEAAAAQAAAQTYTDNALAGFSAPGSVTASQMNAAIGNAIAAIPTSASSQTNPALLTPSDWAAFNAKQGALGFTPLNPANSLSELTNAATARANLGLGTAATQASSAFDASGAATAAVGAIPTSGSTQTNAALITPTDWATFNGKQAALGFTPLNAATNLSDLGNAATARTNLRLGSAAVQNAGAFDASGAASSAVAAIPTSSNTQTNPALITATDWTNFNSKQAALTVSNDTNVTGSISSGRLTMGWTGTLAKTRLLTTTVFSDQANTFAAGNKQTFTASASTAGLNLAPVSANPSSPASGDVWMRPDLSHILFYSASAVQTVLSNADVSGYSTQSGLVGKGPNYAASNAMICLDTNSNVSTSTCTAPVPAAPTSSTLGGVKTISCGAGSHMNSISTAGVVSCTADASSSSTISFKQPYIYDGTNYYIPDDALSIVNLPSAIVSSMAFLTGTPQSPGVSPTVQTNGDVIVADTASNGPYYWGMSGSSSVEAVMTFGGGSASKMGVWVWDSTLNKMFIFPITQGNGTMNWQTASYNGTTMGSTTGVNNTYVPIAPTAHLRLTVNASTGNVTLQQTINAGGYWNTLVNSNQSINHPAQFGIMFSADTIDVKSIKIQ